MGVGRGTRCFQSHESKAPPAPLPPRAPSRPGDEHSGAGSPSPPRRTAATPHRLLRYRRAGRDPRAPCPELPLCTSWEPPLRARPWPRPRPPPAMSQNLFTIKIWKTMEGSASHPPGEGGDGAGRLPRFHP